MCWQQIWPWNRSNSLHGTIMKDPVYQIWIFYYHLLQKIWTRFKILWQTHNGNYNFLNFWALYTFNDLFLSSICADCLRSCCCRPKDRRLPDLAELVRGPYTTHSPGQGGPSWCHRDPQGPQQTYTGGKHQDRADPGFPQSLKSPWILGFPWKWICLWKVLEF